MNWDLKEKMVEGGHSSLKKWYGQLWREDVKRYRGSRIAHMYVQAAWNVGVLKKSDKDCWNHNAAALEYGGPLSIFE